MAFPVPPRLHWCRSDIVGTQFTGALTLWAALNYHGPQPGGERWSLGGRRSEAIFSLLQAEIRKCSGLTSPLRRKFTLIHLKNIK